MATYSSLLITLVLLTPSSFTHTIEPLHTAVVSGTARRLIHSAPRFFAALQGATHNVVAHRILQIPQHICFSHLPDHVQEFVEAHHEHLHDPELLKEVHTLFKYIHLKNADTQATIFELLFTPIDTIAAFKARRDVYLLKSYAQSFNKSTNRH